LDEFVATPVRQLSLGQRMRGEITAALLHRPDVLFLDEPTIGLDVVSKQAVRAFLAAIGAAGDTTLMLTTHDLADIERLCPRLVVIDRGRVVHDGSLSELHARYQSRRRVVVDLDAPLGEVEAVTAAIGDVGPGVTVEHVSPDGRRLEFGLLDGANAGALVARIAAVASLRDLSVIEPDIEDVVARIYQD
jgi:ABC-2 type transport system ATP-binding protein